MELVDVGDLVKGSEFKVFTDWANADDGRVVALRAPGAASLSRKQLDELAAHAAKYGAKGLAWMKVEDAGKGRDGINSRSEEHTSELQSLMRISYAVFCLQKQKNKQQRCNT